MSNEFNLIMGQSPPGETYNEWGEGLPFYQGRKDFGFRYPSIRVYCTQPTRLAQPGDTLVSVRAPVGDLNMAMDECCIGRGVAAARHKSQSRSFTYYSFQSLEPIFRNFEGEGTVFGSISKQDFARIKIIIPPVQVVELFEAITFPMDQSIENNENQLQILVELRDFLLPKLVSGQLRVEEAEKLI